VTPLMFGRVVFGEGAKPYVEVLQPPFDPKWFVSNPEDFGADFRWVVYAVVQLHKPGLQIAVGFTHNTYTLDTRFSVAQRMPWVVEAIKAKRTVRVDRVIVGGDFNTLPHELNERHPAYSYWDVVKNQPTVFLGGKPNGTTWAGQLFDYWISDIPLTNSDPIVPGGEPVPKPSIDTSTWDGPDGLMSDHVAALLRIV
jgi:hypothetical protein